jgi:hypothetical protein
MVRSNPDCGRACLPIEEYEPLVERIVELERLLAESRECLEAVGKLVAAQRTPTRDEGRTT